MAYRPSKAFYVTSETDDQIDDLQIALGCSRSQVLRTAIAHSWEVNADRIRTAGAAPNTDNPHVLSAVRRQLDREPAGVEGQAPPQPRTAGTEEA